MSFHTNPSFAIILYFANPKSKPLDSELLYQLALTLVPNIGDAHAKVLIQHFGNASSIFKAKASTLEQIEGMGTVRANCIKKFNDFDKAENELLFIEKYKINPLFLTDNNYPRRLLNCYDSPSLLFYKGEADLNAPRIISIVGTRNNTDYGRSFTEKLIKELTDENVLIVSGLAFGIDAISHKAALKNGLPTIGVVGHGLDVIYPPENTSLAKEMVQQKGGIISEFFSGTKPDRHNFPLRNRIVAGLADATIVIETPVKGGSMITAKLADAYNRDIFAVPGRADDQKSKGCNYLIQHNRAILLSDAKQLLEVMGWEERKKDKASMQRQLFIELTPDEKQIINLLQEKEAVHIDEINLRCSLTSSSIAAAILSLELQNVIATLPGKIYKLL